MPPVHIQLLGETTRQLIMNDPHQFTPKNDRAFRTISLRQGYIVQPALLITRHVKVLISRIDEMRLTKLWL